MQSTTSEPQQAETPRDRAKLRAEVDRVLAGDGLESEATAEEDVELESELLAKLEMRLDEKVRAEVDPLYDTEAEFDVAFETAVAEELDAPIAEGEFAIINEPTGEVVGIYSESSGEVTPLLDSTEEELVESIFEDQPAQPTLGQEPPAAPRLVRTSVKLRDIHFAFDRYVLTERARAILQQNGEYIRRTGDRVVIEGHCDERGSVEYNLALGEKRAKNAYDYLVTLGVDPDQMEVISYGEEFPLDPRSNEIAWAKNRRAHFRAAN